MNEERFCRRCLLIESGRQDVKAEISEHISKIPAGDKTDDIEYGERLAKCKKCDFLEDGTCLKCGCYPEFRAAFKKNKCPYKKW